ncbi:MAG: hypothetical protein V1913_11130 [Fibrobacterota bacterium]
MAKGSKIDAFAQEVDLILNLEVVHKVNKLGGYGAKSEVIYYGHPSGCASVLVDSQKNATATFVSNGGVGFNLKLDNGWDVRVLDNHFDMSEKREMGVPSNNVWIDVASKGRKCIASLMNPQNNINCAPERIKLVKLGDPNRAMWYCAWFKPMPGVRFVTAVKLSLVYSASGPAVLRRIFVKNLSQKPLKATLWTFYFLHGTQRFVYNKELWYDMGLPVSDTELIMNATVPYSDVLQIKRLSSQVQNARPVSATCDYATFVGDTRSLSTMPQAVLKGKMLEGGAGRKLNRFATAAVGANQFALSLKGGTVATVQQSLLYVLDKKTIGNFRANAAYVQPTYKAMVERFTAASKALIQETPGPSELAESGAPKAVERGHPHFEVTLPTQRVMSEYANSVWIGVKELYENCRAHGARMADGIELGTRDRGQDMWPKLKEDPGRVRADLLHVMSMMYHTTDENLEGVQRLTLRQKLHGMFPRQYPSQWLDRTKEVPNDNRPYTDSPLWLINSINMYLRETGDLSLLLETVKTVRLTDPDHPITSGIIGNDREYKVIEVVREVLACFERHANDSPYGISQILYGDWCDPVDMFGTSVVCDDKTRGHGQGVQTRLTAHVFLTVVETLDILDSKKVQALLAQSGTTIDRTRLERFANRLRENMVRVAWEDTGAPGFPAAFLNVIHELKVDGSVPDYAAGETGYTLGSYLGKDFDGIQRRELGSQAYGLEMMVTERPYLSRPADTDVIVKKILWLFDHFFQRPKLGLTMFTVPIANNAPSVRLCGRMGMLPSGCAENGEYHHCQAMAHRFRLSAPGQADAVWENFKPMMSALRDESIAGPFETPSTSYVSDIHDPHFGKGMYFGLSGSVDWIVEVFHKIAGIQFNLHNPERPALTVTPDLPRALDNQYTFRRVIHCATGPGLYREVPLTVEIKKEGKGKTFLSQSVKINGQAQSAAVVRELSGVKALHIEIIGNFGA